MLPPDTTKKQSNIHHPSSPELSFSFGFLFSVLPHFREHIFLARTSISAFFLNILAHIYKIMNKSNYVVQKLWPPLGSIVHLLLVKEKTIPKRNGCGHVGCWLTLSEQPLLRTSGPTESKRCIRRFETTFHTRFHWAIGDIVLLIILLCDSRNVGFFYNSTWKMKLRFFFIIQHGKWNWCRWGSIPIILD